MTPMKTTSADSRWFCRLACCFVLACSAWTAASAAQAEAPVIARITVRGNFVLTAEQVMTSLGVQEGERLDREKLKAAANRWNVSAVLGQISYGTEPAEQGAVELVLELEERVKVTGVAFNGNKKLSSRRLRKLVEIAAGDVVAEGSVRAAEHAIIAAYREKGYSATSAYGVLVMREPGERLLVFQISDGARTHVVGRAFVGNEAMSDKELRGQMKSKKRKWPPFLWPGWLDKERFEADVTRIESHYRSEGYLDAQVSGEATYSEDMEEATLHVEVEEGALYRVREIVFEGNTLFREDELLAAIPLAPGEAFRPADLTASASAISALYAEHGHVDVTQRKGNLSAERVLAEDRPEVDVRIRIGEGERVYIRRIEIRGLERTEEHVIRRQLNFYPGEIASTKKLRESELLLLNTGFFDMETRKPVDITLEPDEGTLRDAVVRVTEGPTGRLLLGGGVGSEAGVFGELSLVEENFHAGRWPSSWSDLWRGKAFRGGGHRLSMVLRAGTDSAYYSLSFLNPAVRDGKYSLGTQLYHTSSVQEEFEDVRTGFGVTGGRRLSKFMQRSLTLGFERIDINDVDATAPAEVQMDEGSHDKPYVSFDTTFDRRDSRFMPTEGYALGAGVEVGAGDVEIVRVIVRGEKHWTVWQKHGTYKHVVGLLGRAGIVESYGDRVPVFERFYAGGFSTLRGFDYRGVSPVDPATRDQIGGESLLVGAVEYSLPLTATGGLRLVGFMDSGYVAEDANDVLTGWDELRLSVGVGLRWRLAFFGPAPLEVNLAFPLMKESDDDTQAFHFAIGAERRF